jgi:hypothetical protein
MRKMISSAIVMVLAGTAARADVTWVHQVKSGGFKGWAASAGTEVRRLRGTSSREENLGKMTGAVLGKITRASDRATLIRLDPGVIDRLDIRKKTYEETSIAEIQLMKEKAENKTAQARREAGPPTHKITRSEFKVTSTGASKTINGFPCKQYLVEMLLEIEDLKTHDKGRMRMVTTLWTTPETAAMKQAHQEERVFAEAYLKKLGMDLSPQETARFGAGVMTQLSGAGEKDLDKALARATQEMKKVSGYPVVTQVDWYMEGAESTKAPAPQATARASAAEEDSPVDVTHGVSGALGGLASNWAKKKVARKMEDRQQAQEGKTLFSFTSELQELSLDAIPESEFTVPAGFKKIVREEASLNGNAR